MTNIERKALREFCHRLRSHFKGQIADIRLFGSKATGKSGCQSDLDVLVLIEEMNYEDKRWAITLGADISLKYLVEISPLCLIPEQFRGLRLRERRIALDIEHEGIAL